MPWATTAASTTGISLMTRNGMKAASPNTMIPDTSVENSAKPLSTTPSLGFPVAPTPPSAPRPTARAMAIAILEMIRPARSSSIRRRTEASAGQTATAQASGHSATVR